MENTYAGPMTPVPGTGYAGRHRDGAAATLDFTPPPHLSTPPAPTPTVEAPVPEAFIPPPPPPTPRQPAPTPLSAPPIFETRDVPDNDPEDVHGLEILFRAGYDGPAKQPLLGPIRRPGRRTHLLAATTGVLSFAATLILGSSSLGVAFSLGGVTDETRPVVATYERPDGSLTDLRKVNCTMLARDIVVSGVPVQGGPTVATVERVRTAVTVVDNITQVADLPKGDILHQALACRAIARWSDGTKQKIAMSLTVYGAEASLHSTTVRRR